MSRRFSRISLALVILSSSEVWALGLGEIRMESALNEPLNATIELLSATPDELDNLRVSLASAETFERYGIERPFYLQNMQLIIVRSGRADGNYVRATSSAPMAEPFLTFLIEASWSRGRLLREYTVFLDPPTFAPPSANQAPPIQAPSRTSPADSGRIERSSPPPGPAPQTQSAAPTRTATPQPQPKPQPPADVVPYDSSADGDYDVQRNETLWGIASRVKPDSRLTMNQTMLAIFEANPDAFGGNINVLRAGASLRVPSADEIFRISRGDALQEAQRQHAEWTGGTVPPVDETTSRPSLTLVPPDDDYVDDTLAPEPQFDDEPATREQEIENRIAELESADVPQQRTLIEIRDNELAALRDELSRIRGEVYDPVDDAVEEPAIDEPLDAAPVADAGDEELPADDEEPVADVEDAPAQDVIRTQTRPEPSLVDRAMEMLASWWIIIAGALVVVGGALFWFMRRSDDDDDVDSWQPLDVDDVGADDLAATESLRAPASADDSIVVVEQESTMRPMEDETVDAPAPEFEAGARAEAESADETGQFDSLEDTFSSETAINLDQSDPIAEADFHMAYGLYDQAADLINGALSVEPDRDDLLTKLCEIYFVWGNRDSFVDAAGRLKAVVGDDESADWDKIVIMGQQIAADDDLFAGAIPAAATKAVDLSFEADMEEAGALDMELVAESEHLTEVVDLGGDIDETAALETDEGVDFVIEGDDETEVAVVDDTADSMIAEAPDFDVTKEMPTADETAEMPAPEGDSPTIEEQFDVLSGTAELPSIDSTVGDAIEAPDETAEINLDDLGLDVDGLAETELASLDDLDATGEIAALDDTGINEALEDHAAVTGRNPAVDPDSTGVQTVVSGDETGMTEALDVEDALAATSEMPGISEAPDEPADLTATGIDESLLDATGVTQVLSDDLAVATASDVGGALSDDEAALLASGYGDDTVDTGLEDDAETLLASLDDDADESEFDFAKTEALPKEAFSGDSALDETGEMPAVASTDVDLDLSDLTAALKVSEGGDTVEQLRDDATVEQPRPDIAADLDETMGTVALDPEEMSDDLSDARTMTEVGTKLDLARAYVDMGDPAGARSILDEVLDEGDDGQRQQAQQLLDSLPA